MKRAISTLLLPTMLLTGCGIPLGQMTEPIGPNLTASARYQGPSEAEIDRLIRDTIRQSTQPGEKAQLKDLLTRGSHHQKLAFLKDWAALHPVPAPQLDNPILPPPLIADMASELDHATHYVAAHARNPMVQAAMNRFLLRASASEKLALLAVLSQQEHELFSPADNGLVIEAGKFIVKKAVETATSELVKKGIEKAWPEIEKRARDLGRELEKRQQERQPRLGPGGING